MPIPEMPPELKQVIEETDSKMTQTRSDAPRATRVRRHAWRCDVQNLAKREQRFRDYSVDVVPGMVVLDAMHQIQATQAPDLAVRWNCKAGKCGSCSAEINGNPRLMCMTRLNSSADGRAGHRRADAAFPLIKDLVTDVSWNYRVKKTIKPFKPRPPDAPDGTWRMFQKDVDRVQEFRKCIECFLCQDVCHILRDHQLHDGFIGPRFLTYAAALEMHPLDVEDRVPALKDAARHRLLQHHALLHEGLPRAHHDHGECDHSAQGAGRRSVLRSGHAAAAGVSILR